MPTTPSAKPSKNALEIRLAESVVFLRAGDATGRRRTLQSDPSPGMVRGLLVLNLAKPTRITSIEVELVGKTVIAWPEGVGARRIEITEEHEIYSQSYVFFRAGETVGTSHRRNLSVGPGLSLEHEDEDISERSSYIQDPRDRDESRGRSPPRRSSPSRPSTLSRPARRYMSVDQTHFQRSFVSHHENTYPAIASPPYSPTHSVDETSLHLSPTSTVIPRSSLPPFEDTPNHSIEDLRHALESDQYLNRLARSTSRQGRSSSGVWSPRVADSQRVSIDEERDFVTGSSTSHLPQPGPSHETIVRDARTPSRQRSTEEDDTHRGRKGKHLSFASAFFEAMKDRVRSRSPMVERVRDFSGDRTPPRGRTRDRASMDIQDGISGGALESSTLGRVEEAPDCEEGKGGADGWKEFRKGVYTYPVSFAIPAMAPPTLHVDYGHVTWKLKAVVHRPGAFRSKLTAMQEITVVPTPGEDDTEESESIIVERQWDTQMQYLIVISGRSFAIGGTMPLSVTFMPWTKMKIHRITVLIEERVDYWTGFKRVARSDPVTRIALLSLKYMKKDSPPLLPLADDPDAFSHSPLRALVDPNQDPSEAMSDYMGPGPWVIKKDLHLPNVGHGLHITNKNRRSNIFVSHMLKIIFRVERGDDSALDDSGKRKLFDIVVQTPIHILSHLCNPEHISLPPYSRFPDPSSSTVSTSARVPLSVVSDGDIMSPGPLPPIDLSNPGPGTVFQRRALSLSASALSPQASSSTTSSLSAHAHVNGRGVSPGAPPPLPLPHTASDDSLPAPGEPAHTSPTGSVMMTMTNHTNTPPLSLSRRPSDHELTTPERFERLVAGQETEEGEAPPSYEAAVEAREASRG